MTGHSIRSPNALPEEFFGLGRGLEARARLKILTKILKALPLMPAPKLSLFHHFAPTQYGRELHMAAGTLIVGKIHKHSHVNVVSKGKCIVATFEGEQLITAPATFVSPKGVQRAVYCIEDTVWTTLHTVTQEQSDLGIKNLNLIEQDIIATNYNDPALPLTFESSTTRKELDL